MLFIFQNFRLALINRRRRRRCCFPSFLWGKFSEKEKYFPGSFVGIRDFKHSTWLAKKIIFGRRVHWNVTCLGVKSQDRSSTVWKKTPLKEKRKVKFLHFLLSCKVFISYLFFAVINPSLCNFFSYIFFPDCKSFLLSLHCDLLMSVNRWMLPQH